MLSKIVLDCQSHHQRIIHTFLRLFQPLHTQQQQQQQQKQKHTHIRKGN